MENEKSKRNEYSKPSEGNVRLQAMNLSFIDSLPCGICIVEDNEVLSIIYANDAFYSLFGYTSQEANEYGFFDFEYITERDGFPRFRQEVTEGLWVQQKDFSIDAQYYHKGGDTRWFRLTCNKKRHGGGTLVFGISDVTKLKAMEHELKILEDEQRIVMQQTGRIIVKYDVATRTLIQPKIAADMFGLPCVCPDVPNGIIKELVAEESKQVFVRFYESMMDGKPYGSSFVQVKNVTGNYAWYAFKYTLTFDRQGKPFRAIITYEDVTDQQEKELAYKKWQNYFASQQADSIAHYEYDLTNDIFESMVGELQDDLPEGSLESFSKITEYAANHFIDPEDKDNYLSFFSRNKLLVKYYMGQKEFQFEHRRIRKDGSVFWALAVLQLVSDPYTNHIKASVLIKDINEEKESIIELQQLSCTDPLTGLYNRSYMEKKTNAFFRNCSLMENHILLMVDLDNFKQLNDTLGHQFGDRVLCDVAKALRKEIRRDDLCARLGGDEFIALLKNTGLDVNLSNRLQRLSASLSKCYCEGIKTSASIGLAIYPRDGKTFEELYAKADVALYQAKRNGRNQFVFYEGK